MLKKIINGIDAIRGLMAFMTKIPMGNFKSGFKEMSHHYTFIIFIGLFIGLIGAPCSYPFYYFDIGGIIVGVVVLFVMLYIQGFHHVDGLGDYGDAWMVMGAPEKKLIVMRDKYMGVGAFAFIFFVELLSISAISAIYLNSTFLQFVKLIILAEGCSRLGSLCCASLGAPSNSGTGRYFIENTKKIHLFIGIIILLFISYLIGIFKIGLMAVAVAVLVGIVIVKSSKKSFGCITGDILGASCEITRAFVLLIMVFLININMGII
ncbi:adenosylcobinamide-GDP ribazoletransferase [Methanococcus aeolicus]|uniref:Adenosylcobinamide-GDP ribazoletransferase n=1 Tax=Methanococcus aeolicus (strain ATCC BAA-1280 / DSM 17508 / OCM 812 / Nankai-3) TaxID=419665 RepID=A6UW85_META3|nr:adenosylcobinamide-GDP ribazoletransferase [Methanococcus aeolicus]ABR56757.1 cobalamin 5'-phosphate synthase [Methanococcus aeolicus Nankai-3]UXM84757.1 adenosylcobinamide-GDP ribazoletransferase [Methanococcus aeolicus]